MPLTQEQFNELRKKGLSIEQIVKFEKGNTTPEPEKKEQSYLAKATEPTRELFTGVRKGLVSTVRGASSLGEKMLRKPWEAVGLMDKQEETGAQQLIPEQKPEGFYQNVGFYGEQIAEFLIPSSGVAKLEKGMRLVPKVLTEAAIVGGQTAIQQGEINDDTKTAAIVAGLFPVGGALLSKTKGALKPIGEKIQTSVIKPSTRDIADGFKIQNINKYDLGGSLAETATKVNVKLNQLGKELQTALKDEANRAVNLNNVFKQTEDELLSISKSSSFGNIKATKRVLTNLKDEIDEVAGKNGLVDLIEATQIKRGAGTKGSWAFGRAEADASATETVYTTFYNKIKGAIEKASPNNLKEINNKISELIPINNAVIRRLPVEARNNVISLTDSIGLFGAMFDPKALALIGANKLSKSGKLGAYLAKLGTKKQASTALGERIFGGNLDDLKDLKAGLSIEDVTQQIADNIDAEDLGIMTKFIDNVRVSRGTSKNLDSEIAGRSLAEAMGFNPDITASRLADIFDKIIQWSRGRVITPW